MTDGASLPWYTWSLLKCDPWSQPLLPCALAHDAWYMAELGSKDDGDRLFLDFMAKTGRIGYTRRHLIYVGPHLFGGNVWRAHTKDSIAHARCYCQLVPADCAAPVWPEVPVDVAIAAHAVQRRRQRDRDLGLC